MISAYLDWEAAVMSTSVAMALQHAKLEFIFRTEGVGVIFFSSDCVHP